MLPLPPPLTGAEPGTFAHFTVTERLPAIVELAITENSYPANIVGALQSLKAELPDGQVRPLREDGGPDLEAWAGYVALFLGQRWLDVPWFFAEAYFYRRILEATHYFEPGPWQGIDPFEAQKRLSLATAEDSIRALSVLVNELATADTDWDPDAFITLSYYELWGNRVDLSIWPAGVTESDRSRVDVHVERAHLLVDESEAVANTVGTLKGARIDLIVDNAGFELFGDLCMADFLLSSGVAGAVHLHVKPHPTFVSDAMIKDVTYTVERLRAGLEPPVRTLAGRLQGFLDADRLQVREHLFWTAPLAFWEMPDDLHQDLTAADLVFIKGDANYRRLLGDRHWPFTTPLADIASYFPAPFVALRALKSEVVAGLRPGQPEEVAQADSTWLTDGRWGLIQLVPSPSPPARPG